METKKELNYFQTLDAIDISGHVETKNGLSYLSWAWAWKIVKEHHPDATYKIYERDTEYGPVNYFTDGATCWVKTGLTINDIEYIEMLPVMDYKNRSILLNDITSFDVNKAIQRSLTKAAARHGVGIRLYSGEDLPESEAEAKARAVEQKKIANTKVKPLIMNIGNMIKDKKIEMADYKKIVEEVTGSKTFSVNKATDEDYETVSTIYNKMLGK